MAWVVGALLAGWGGALIAADVDTSAAEALVKKSGCLACHSVTQKKVAPSYKSIAAKYQGKTDAEPALVKHLIANPKVKMDGRDEEHDALKTRNDAEVRNVAKWILSR